jgi:hypothetical protein
LISAADSGTFPAAEDPMNNTVERPRGRRINWISVLTVASAAILIGAVVFGAAFAGGWAVAYLLGFGDYDYSVPIMQGLFFVLGMMVMVAFVRSAQRVEPFTTAD